MTNWRDVKKNNEITEWLGWWERASVPLNIWYPNE